MTDTMKVEIEVPLFWSATWPTTAFVAGDVVRAEFDADGNLLDIEGDYAGMESAELDALVERVGVAVW